MRADETPAAELWSRTLVQIPCTFGRLAYIASLRDPNSGAYRHFGFSQRFSDKTVDKTIAHSHLNVFMDWLCLSLEQQKADLETYFSSVDGEREAVLANWRTWPPYMNWLPAQSRAADRELFQSDLEIVLDLITRDFGAASTDRIA